MCHKVWAVLFFSVGFLFKGPSTNAATHSDVVSLHTTLTSSYNKHVRPKTNQDERTDINLTMSLKSLTGLDEVNGIMTTVSGTTVTWVDDNLNWTPGSHNGITDIKIDESLIWTPLFFTSNPAKKLEKLGLPSVETTVFYTGEVMYSIAEMMQTTCDVFPI